MEREEWREVAPGLRVHRNVKNAAPCVTVWERAPARARRVPAAVQVSPAGMGRERGGYWRDYPGVGALIGLERATDWEVFAHELGHHTQACTFTAEEAARWQAFFRANRRKMPRKAGGPADTPSEGAWAECFARYVQGRKLNPEVRAHVESYFE
jgi:hypothetical protein